MTTERDEAAILSRTIGASEAHLAKVLQHLYHEGLVSGARGPGAGFTLAAHRDALSLRRVYEAIEGPRSIRECLVGVPIRAGAACPLEALLRQVSCDLTDGLARVAV